MSFTALIRRSRNNLKPAMKSRTTSPSCCWKHRPKKPPHSRNLSSSKIVPLEKSCASNHLAPAKLNYDCFELFWELRHGLGWNRDPPVLSGSLPDNSSLASQNNINRSAGCRPERARLPVPPGNQPSILIKSNGYLNLICSKSE